MRVVFFGSTQYSLLVLNKLMELGEEIPLVVTIPQRRAGRQMMLKSSAVEKFSKDKGLNVIAPEQINSLEVIEKIVSLSPDLFIVCEYGKIFGDRILKIPRILPLNIHPSLLPRYRGPSPINWQIINGESISGVTFHKIIAKVDAGEIIYQCSLLIDNNDDAPALHIKLLNLAISVLPRVLERLRERNFELIPQDESQASICPALSKEMGLIDWQREAKVIFNLIRGLLPWPGTFTYLKDKLIKIFKSRIFAEEEVRGKAGEIVRVEKRSFFVQCGRGILEILELQPQSKRRMSAREFISGYRIKEGSSFRTIH